MTEVARKEIEAWHRGLHPLHRGLAMAILFAFIHRYTTGQTVEESFFKSSPIEPDYEI